MKSDTHRVGRILLAVALLVGGLLRLYRLGEVPLHPNWDEAALGWNAYSILKTGADEYGNVMPLAFRSFGDYKPPVYVYAAVPSILMFGLSVAAVRLPSAVAGIILIVGVYLLVRDWSRRVAGFGPWGTALAGTASLVIAILPWAVHFSRGAFEANLGLAFFVLGIWALMRIDSGSWFSVLSPIFLGISMMTYHSYKIVAPIIGLGTLFLLRIPRMRTHAQVRRFLVMSAVITAGVFYQLVSQGSARLEGTSIFNRQPDILKRQSVKIAADQADGRTLGALINDRRLEWVKTIATGYLDHFSPKWIYVTGDHPRHHAPDTGLLYLWMMPFTLFGFVWLLKVARVSGFFWVLWLAAAPVAAAITIESPHAIRSIAMLVPLAVFTASGIAAVIGKLRRHAMAQTLGAALFIGIAGIFLARYASLYFSHMNREYNRYWQDGYGEMVMRLTDEAQSYDQIYVSGNLEQPYIFALFYARYDPASYQHDGGSEVKKLGNIYFSGIPDMLPQGRTLVVGTPDELSAPYDIEFADSTGQRIAVGAVYNE